MRDGRHPLEVPVCTPVPFHALLSGPVVRDYQFVDLAPAPGIPVDHAAGGDPIDEVV